jgi:hypothetical protein
MVATLATIMQLELHQLIRIEISCGRPEITRIGFRVVIAGDRPKLQLTVSGDNRTRHICQWHGFTSWRCGRTGSFSDSC